MSARPPGRGSRPGPGRRPPPGGRSPRSPTRTTNAQPRHTVTEAKGGRVAAQPPSRGIRPAVLFGGVIAIAVVLIIVRHIHPGHVGTPAAARKPPPPVHFSVGLARCTFTDTTRGTKNYGTGALDPDRVLTTEIRYPTISPAAGASETMNANPARRHGPFPLIVFAHGYDLTPDTYANLLDVWVKAGFVVAAPLFPDTNAVTVDGLGKIFAPEADDADQPGDVAFVVKTVLADAVAPTSGCPLLHKLVTPGGAAIAGQSDGAITVDALAYGAAYQVPGTPIRAVISLSGEEYPAPSGQPTPYASSNGGPPLLVTQSATDQCNPPQNSTTLYSAIHQADKWFLEIDHANHLPPYTGALASQIASFKVVSAVTTTFLKDVFSGKKIGHSFLALGNLRPTVAHLTTGGTPRLPTLEMISDSCYVN